MICRRYLPDIGGVEKHVSRVAEAIALRGYTVAVLTASPARRSLPSDDAGPIRIVRIPLPYSRIVMLAPIWIAMRLRELSSYDVVHFHDTETLLWGLPIVLSRAKKRVFVTYHGFERDPVPVYWKTIRRAVSRLVERSLCIGQFIQKEYAVHCSQFAIGAADPHHPVSAREQCVVFVGRLERDTGIVGYLEALKIVKSEYGLNLPACIYGSGSLQECLSRLVISEQIPVRLLGSVKDVFSAMRQSSICLASGYLSIIEAMSLGLPVIGLASTPLKIAYLKSIRNAGAPLSIQTTPEGVAREISRVIGNDALRDFLAKRGHAFAAKMTWVGLADVYIRLWKGSATES